MVEQQAHLAIEAIAAVDDAEKGMQIHQWHKRVDKLDVGLKQSILERNVGQRQGALHLQVAHIFGSNLAGQRAEERWELWRSLGRSTLEVKLVEGTRDACRAGDGAGIAKQTVRVDCGVPGEDRSRALLALNS